MVAGCGCEIALKLLVFQSVEGDMVGRGLHFDFLHSKCSSHASCSHVFIFGLIFAYYTTLYSHVQTSTVKCMNLSSKYQHCGIHPDGVHDLDCFGKHISLGVIMCVWKPGNHTSKKTYMLFIKQAPRPSCKVHENITEFSKNILVFVNPNMTVEVFENSESTYCTKAVFRGSPKSLLRCDPPVSASFRRQSGRLDVDVRWQEEDKKVISNYLVSYKALGSPSWSELLLQSQNRTKCTMENLNPSLVYTVRIQCVTNNKCSQCPWSEAYTVPSELTTEPFNVSLKNTDISNENLKTSHRLLSVIWKFSAEERYDGFYVTIGKASGEAPCKQLITTQPEIQLILSYSAYHLTISAFNNASTSPAVNQTIPQRENKPSMGAGELNVTVHNEKSFTIYWKDNLIKNYVCFSVEWMKKGHKAAYKSFYEDKNNYRTLSPLPEPLEPHERYSIILHTRPNKDTCNLKHINNSESTYGSTQFYFTEGSPVSAPEISSYNVTHSSVALQWSSIPEKDIRGFLLGYIIHYKEKPQKSTERNITVDPLLNSYQLADLKSGTVYEVEISGFTRAGAGVRSNICLFTTNSEDYIHLSVVITVLVVLSAVLVFGTPIIKRARVILWPSIPNPGNSSAMQKIEGPCELELLECINTLKVEEWDTHSLQIVEKENVVLASTLASMLPLLHASDNEEDSTEMTRSWIHSDTEDATGDFEPDSTSETFSANQQTHHQSPPFAFSSDYTTMEMFQQVVPQGVPANTSVTEAIESEPEDTDLIGVKSGLDYVRQFSTSPTWGSEEMSMVF